MIHANGGQVLRGVAMLVSALNIVPQKFYGNKVHFVLVCYRIHYWVSLLRIILHLSVLQCDSWAEVSIFSAFTLLWCNGRWRNAYSRSSLVRLPCHWTVFSTISNSRWLAGTPISFVLLCGASSNWRSCGLSVCGVFNKRLASKSVRQENFVLPSKKTTSWFHSSFYDMRLEKKLLTSYKNMDPGA